MYAIRRIKDGFRMHKNESDEATLDQLIKQAEHNYGIIQRQVRLSQMYTDQMLVIEKQSDHNT